MITPYTFPTIHDWSIRISDNNPSTRNHENPNKYNWQKNDRQCKYVDCAETFYRSRTSGLCDNHINHTHDLFLEVFDPNGNTITPPRHKDIIDALMKWASTRNFSLDNFFSELSFNILGNVPDVTSLSGDIVLENYPAMPTLSEIYQFIHPIIEKYFPSNNSSSYQELNTPPGNMPAILLANIFVGLLICEEANRGDRWFCRTIMKDEEQTKQLGAAMPLAYYASKTFHWGVELNKTVSHKLTL